MTRTTIAAVALWAAGCTAENPWYDTGLPVTVTSDAATTPPPPPDMSPPPDWAGTCGNVEGGECCQNEFGKIYCNFGMQCWRLSSGALQCGF
jgi:hypothetical protein